MGDFLLHLVTILLCAGAFFATVKSVGLVELKHHETRRQVTHMAAYARMSVAAGTLAAPGVYALNPVGGQFLAAGYLLTIGWMVLTGLMVRDFNRRALAAADEPPIDPADIPIIMAPTALKELLPEQPKPVVKALDAVAQQLLSRPDAQIVYLDVDGAGADPNDPDGNLAHLSDGEKEAWDRWAEGNPSTATAQESRRRERSRPPVEQMCLEQQAAYWRFVAERRKAEYRKLAEKNRASEDPS